MPKILEFFIDPTLLKVYTKTCTLSNIKDMTTKVIGIKNFRNNITKLWKTARDSKTKYIVMYHSAPILEVRPITEKELAFKALASEIAEARGQVERGEVYTEEEIKKELGLK